MSNKKLNQLFGVVKLLLAIVIAMILAFLVIALISEEPGVAIRSFLTGPFSSRMRFGNMLEYFIPVAFTALGYCIMYSVGLCSVIGEGTVFFGGLVATAVALKINIGSFGSSAVSILVAGVVCALIAAFPMLLKLKFDADLFVSSLMMNYILLHIGVYILSYPLRDASTGIPATYKIPKAARLTKLIPGTNVTTALILTIVVLILGYLFMEKTRWGYKMKLVGSNKKFAVYSGINVFRACLLSAILGGFLSGMGGAAEILGRYSRFQWTGLPGFGWDGILIATIAGFQPKYVALATLFMAYIKTGADVMNAQSDVASEMIIVVQAFLILLIASKGFLARTQQKLLVRNVKKMQEKEVKS